MDAIAMLKADHDKVKKLLTELETTTERGVKTRERALRHDQGRADHPRDHRGGDLLPGAEGAPEGQGHRPRGLRGAPRRRPAHGRARGARRQRRDVGRKSTVMKENIEHHIEEEEGEMFKQARQVFDARSSRSSARGWRSASPPRSASSACRSPADVSGGSVESALVHHAAAGPRRPRPREPAPGQREPGRAARELQGDDQDDQQPRNARARPRARSNRPARAGAAQRSRQHPVGDRPTRATPRPVVADRQRPRRGRAHPTGVADPDPGSGVGPADALGSGACDSSGVPLAGGSIDADPDGPTDGPGLADGSPPVGVGCRRRRRLLARVVGGTGARSGRRAAASERASGPALAWAVGFGVGAGVGTGVGAGVGAGVGVGVGAGVPTVNASAIVGRLPEPQIAEPAAPGLSYAVPDHVIVPAADAVPVTRNTARSPTGRPDQRVLVVRVLEGHAGRAGRRRDGLPAMGRGGRVSLDRDDRERRHRERRTGSRSRCTRSPRHRRSCPCSWRSG